MIDKIKSTAEKYSMFRPDARVVAAVSGGSDSMAMLTALNMLKAEYGFTLCAAHVNHCLRGNDADSDEAFVCEKCREMGVELYVKKADIKRLAAEKGIGLEECGRQVRYEFFESLGDDVIIATAHNLSDKTETFLFNFSRGSALRGLCSIPAVRGNVVRPLIDCSKAEILEFCEKNGIEYVTDATNSDVKYSRNRIRHNVVTQLREINPAFEECAGRCMESLNEDEAFLASLAADAVENARRENGWDADFLAKLPLPVKKRALIAITEKACGITPEYRFMCRLCELLETSGSLQINGGITVRVRKGKVDFPSAPEETPPAVILEKSAFFGGALIETEIINIAETNNLQKISDQVLEYRLDYDKIHGKLLVRSREEGDRITLAARNCGKSLKKLFNELAIPPEKRNSLAVFADEKGIVLVEGAGVSQAVRIDKSTEKILLIRIDRRKGI